MASRRLLLTDVNESAFQRGRSVSRLRYRIGRLLYEGTEVQVSELQELMRGWPELMKDRTLIDALLTGDCSDILELGVNASQAASQIFRSTLSMATFSGPVETEVAMQGMIVFLLNNVSANAASVDSGTPFFSGLWWMVPMWK
jgi:hypothetical protein